jgi:glycosyltransferase involved in cell wall biosynthesis
VVGDDAGVGVEHPESGERDQPPSPEAFAAAVREALGDRQRYGQAARRRVVERFSLEPWLERHAQLFRDVELRGRTSRTR